MTKNITKARQMQEGETYAEIATRTYTVWYKWKRRQDCISNLLFLIDWPLWLFCQSFAVNSIILCTKLLINLLLIKFSMTFLSRNQHQKFRNAWLTVPPDDSFKCKWSINYGSWQTKFQLFLFVLILGSRLLLFPQPADNNRPWSTTETQKKAKIKPQPWKTKNYILYWLKYLVLVNSTLTICTIYKRIIFAHNNQLHKSFVILKISPFQ